MTAMLSQLFEALPVGLQQAACNLEGWRIWRRRYGGGFQQLLEDAERRASQWDRGQLAEFRAGRLAARLAAARAHTAYYRRLDLPPDAPLAAYPLTTKQTVQEAASQFHRPLGGVTWAHTSGTTGAGLRFAVTREAHQEQWAVWWRYRRWHGIGFDSWCGYFGGRMIVPLAQSGPPFWRENRPGRQVLFSGSHLSPASLPAYVGELRRRRPPWLHGYPSLLALVASYLIDRREDLGYPVRWVTTGAENLMPHQARLMEQAFGVRPRQHYGMAEGVANISECEYGRLHVDEDFSEVEFLPEGRQPGVYRVVGTNVTNQATAFIRYDAGDRVRISAETAGRNCPCGRGGRLVDAIDGRAEDYLVLPDGVRLGRLDHIFKDLTRVREAQIAQETPAAMTLRVVRGAGWCGADEAELLAAARSRVGPAIRIDLEYPDRIERTASGKLRLVVSQIPSEKIT